MMKQTYFSSFSITLAVPTITDASPTNQIVDNKSGSRSMPFTPNVNHEILDADSLPQPPPYAAASRNLLPNPASQSPKNHL